MCRNYLSIYNLNIPDSLKDKWEAVFNHKECMKDKVDSFKNIKAQPMTCSIHKIIANIITFLDINITKLSICIK